MYSSTVANSSDCLNTSGDATVDKLSRASSKTSHKNMKNTRLVEICWINIDSAVRRRVKLADGGGIRKVSVAKNSEATDLMSVATPLFFFHKKSGFSHFSEFNCIYRLRFIGPLLCIVSFRCYVYCLM